MIQEQCIAQHAEEAADLWSLRNGFVRRPEISLRELERLDDRIEAHLDGLRIAGREAHDVCTKILPGESAGEIFARFIWSFSTGDSAQIEHVTLASESSAEKARGLSSALGWLRLNDVESYIRKLLQVESPILRRAGIAAAAVHRWNPGTALMEAVLSENNELRARGLRAVGEIGAPDELIRLIPENSEQDPACRFWAAWSLALLWRERQALNLLKHTVEEAAPFAETALQLVLRQMKYEEARHWIEDLFKDPKLIRLAILGVGILGAPADVPTLIEFMASDSLARLSGAAFRMITGRDLKREYLDKPAPERRSAQGDDEEETSDPDEGLPWPDADKVGAFWSELREKFPMGGRYLRGKTLASDSLVDVLRAGRQRERMGAAIALSVREPRRALFNCVAPAKRQYRALRQTPHV